jgi:uncharacterized membrane protein YbaN (DUF454 family)
MRILYTILGLISLILGIIGIFLPVLPTTPFLLLSAGLFFRGSEKLYNWLMNHKHLGPYIRNFRENKSIPLRAKIYSISLLWVSILVSVIFFIPLLFVKILILLIAVAVTVHILRYKTLNGNK